MAMKIGLVQVNAPFTGQRYLPYSVGCLQAYALRNLTEPERYEFLLPVFDEIPVREAVAQLWNADLVAISSYVWGEKKSLEYARVLKHFRPSIGIIMGGPQVTYYSHHLKPWTLEHAKDCAKAYLAKYPFIDMLIRGEGEQPFVAILENAFGDWGNIPSASFIKDGVFHDTSRCERMPSLDDAPSPYLEGIFDPLMREYPQMRWIVTLETNRGCPYQCAFCGWGTEVHQDVFKFPLERVYGDIEWIGQQEIPFAVVGDANFGFKHPFDEDRDIEIARYMAGVKKRYGYPNAYSIQAAKNAAERVYAIHKILHEVGLARVINLAFQSRDRETLKNVKRGNVKDSTYRKIQALAKHEGIPTASDIIPGLPGESCESFMRGIVQIIEDGGTVYPNPLTIEPDAEMFDLDYQKRFGMETAETQMESIHAEVSAEGVSYVRVEALPRKSFSSDAEWRDASIRETGEEIYEKQILVIATASMPKEDFVRTYIFLWTAMLLYFNRLFTIPLIVLRKAFGLKYEELLALFSDRAFDQAEYPIITRIQSLFREKAEEMQCGGDKFCVYNNIRWWANEYAMISLVGEGKLSEFYQEAERLLQAFLKEKDVDLPAGLLEESILLNSGLLKLPDRSEDLDLTLSWNIGEFFTGVLETQEVPLEKKPSRYQADRTSPDRCWNFKQWYVEVVWWLHKGSAYFHDLISRPQIRVEVDGITKLSGHY